MGAYKNIYSKLISLILTIAPLDCFYVTVNVEYVLALHVLLV